MADSSGKSSTYIGIDIGGTGIKGGIVRLKSGHDTNGELHGSRFRIPTPRPATPEHVADTVAEIVAELDSRPKAPQSSNPVGICFPAVIHHGICLSANNIDPSWVGAEVADLFSARLEREVRVLNDADAAGLAESRFGAGVDKAGTVLTITLGTGIGSALVHDGVLIPNLELGSLEFWGGSMAEKKASAAAREREDLDWQVYAKERLQPYLTHVERLFSPDLVIIGGGISKRPDDFMPYLSLRAPIVTADMTNNAGIIGAALFASEASASN
ncbi:polyphosphate--glucose phosphotransferase [Citricoccus muralis]|uniref:ROK family protein n=1 Tax=Citricoccus muralis TaxID=169134 RepID=A0ABY8H4B0_9MICC|nr:ROK family protein [Citricoccus muralis]WFP15492.1 ROK family protein [Citricoccus muralis]